MIHWLTQSHETMPGTATSTLLSASVSFQKFTFLIDSEADRLATLTTEKRRRDWLLGRWTAKRLLQTVIWETSHTTVPLDLITVANNADGVPTIASQLPLVDGKYSISLSHAHGQALVAAHVRDLLAGSAIAEGEKEHVQDPYSFRCIPQVHGASRDAFGYVERVVEHELEAVTDNPTVFDEEDLVVSAGNFHGQPLALALDFLAIAAAELGSISERRTYKLLGGERGLPAFLVANPGLHSGFMIPHYTAASLVSANKQRCMPNSVDTIDSSNGQEDHVSMGAAAALKCWDVVHDVERVLAIELFTAAQALEFRRPKRSSRTVERFVRAFRKQVPFVRRDTVMHPLMEAATAFVRTCEPPRV